MGKKNVHKVAKAKPRKAASLAALIADKAAVDPSLASLFASSSGPVHASSESVVESEVASRPRKGGGDNSDDVSLSSVDEALDDSESDDGFHVGENEGAGEEVEAMEDVASTAIEGSGTANQTTSKKRKRNDADGDLEDAYLKKLARQEEKEAAQRRAERKQNHPASTLNEDGADIEDEPSEAEGNDLDAEDFEIPKHEVLAPSRDETDLEKASRTVFLGNVSTEAITSKSAKKTLLLHLASFIPSLPVHTPPHKVESLRFRSTPFASAIPKKAAFAKKELMDATTKSTNAYVVYSTQAAAKEAAKSLNGTVILDRHLRVDQVAHPAKVDNRRCVFVGNLGFVDDESLIREAETEENGKRRKSKPPGDVEEGLWQEFSKAGAVESVRVVRDAKTRVGKGFAYVQFKDENGVEAALQLNDKKFPPLLPRALRVVRAKAIKRKDVKNQVPSQPMSKGIYNPKLSARDQANLGRATKLLGRAGAAQVRTGKGVASLDAPGSKNTKPEAFVFEGHRASAKQGKTGFKFKKPSNKKAGKPQNRSSKRGAAWKAAGGKNK